MEENKKPENPSVYPDPMRGADQSYSNQNPWQLESGMTLRDYFANSAMSGITNNIVTSQGAGASWEYISEASYKIADAMLKQREL